ncbi:MAG: hypothetical protein J7J89_02260 [Thermoplasmata archaeon]|nr:hypothetical protein [Thermoplasmata archaeon]
MRASIIVFMIAFLVMFSSVDAFVVTKNKKTVTNENDTICIGEIDVEGSKIACKGDLITFKIVPKEFTLYVKYYLDAPRTGFLGFDVAVAAVSPLPDQENKKIVQTFENKGGNISFHISNNRIFFHKEYILVGIYAYIDLSDPFNPDYNFTFDFAFVSVVCLSNIVYVKVKHDVRGEQQNLAVLESLLTV